MLCLIFLHAACCRVLLVQNIEDIDEIARALQQRRNERIDRKSFRQLVVQTLGNRAMPPSQVDFLYQCFDRCEHGFTCCNTRLHDGVGGKVWICGLAIVTYSALFGSVVLKSAGQQGHAPEPSRLSVPVL
jgi:hypothetical protein